MWRYINLSRNRKRLGFITSVEVNMNGTWNRKETCPEIDVGMMKNNIKSFLIIYGTPVVNNVKIHSNLVILADNESEERILQSS